MIGVLIVSSRDKLNRLVTTEEIFHDTIYIYVYIHTHIYIYLTTDIPRHSCIYRWCDATDEISREFVY